MRFVFREALQKPCSQAELNKIVPFGFSLQRQKMVFFSIKIVWFYRVDVYDLVTLWKSCLMVN